MRYRPFGTTGLLVSELGIGGARLGGIFPGASRADMLRTLHVAIDHGITFFDTSDLYTQGESEALLGEAVRGQREKVVLASKVGYRLPTQRKIAARVKPLLKPLVQRLGIKREQLPNAVRGTLSQDFSAATIIKAVEGSLRRLRTDHLDVYQLHSPPTALLANGDVLAPLERLQREGKIRHYGISCETTADALLCLRLSGIASLQVRFSLLDQSILAALVERAGAQGIALIARECFAGSLLARRFDTVELEQIIPDATERTAKYAELHCYQQLAEQSGRSLPETALRFVLSVPQVSVALVGVRTEPHLLENIRRFEAAPLTDAEVRSLRLHARA